MKKLSSLILAVACFTALHSFAYPQSGLKRTSNDQQDRPALALIAANGQYIYRLEKLLALQGSDLKTNQEYLEENKALISKNDRETIESLIKNCKVLIDHTRGLLAKAELYWLAEEDVGSINRHIEPYNQRTLLRVLKLNALPEAEIKAAIEKRGVDFQRNEIGEMELLKSGASRELLSVIRSSYRP